MSYLSIDVANIPVPTDIDNLASQTYPQVFRRNFDASGIALVRFTVAISSTDLRQIMVKLKEALSHRHQQETGMLLVYQSMMRFDQQVTTRFHLDGGPEESYLMLGYEPSNVQSRLSIADLARVSFEYGLSPEVFLSKYNPLLPEGEQVLMPYVTQLDTFDAKFAQIVLINNSRRAYLPDEQSTLGVMHQATVFPEYGERRIINSTMLTPAKDASQAVIGEE